MAGYDTNLAAEFYVLSCLHRLGVTANLTARQQERCARGRGAQSGRRGHGRGQGSRWKYEWPINNLTSLNPERHFVVLVSHEDLIGDPAMPAPRIEVLPFPDIEPFRRTYKGNMTTLSRSAVLRTGSRYENAWNLIEI